MCGIAGIWTRGGGDADRLERDTGVMIDRLRHRGPDDRGVWVDAAAGVALANRRLAVVDLSPGGHQPMTSRDGGVTIAFNGEIYNHHDLRRQLAGQGVGFRSASDTEVLVEAIAHWGLERALAAAHGMFGLAVWQAGPRRLTLVRDRLGEKPLYWCRRGDHLHFASELKSLTAVLASADLTMDRQAMAEYFRRGHIPAPLSAYEQVRQLPPGCWLALAADGTQTQGRHWSAMDAAAAPPPVLSDAEAVAEGRRLLSRSVGRTMVADVPLGVFLSGGIDSTLVAALMQAQSATPIRSYTIGFEAADFDESAAAAATAARLGTRHETLRLGGADLLDLIPALPGMYDEPFADASALPVALLCRLARREVTVALSGDGGDEGYAGYSRHVWAGAMAGWRRHRGALSLLAGGVRLLPSSWIDGAIGLVKPGLRQPADKLAKFLAAVTAPDEAASYLAMLGQWAGADDGGGGLLRDPPPSPSWPDPLMALKGADPALRLQMRDLLGYLPDGVLTKVDRASMAASLEVRAPLLDHEVVAFGLGLPLTQRVRDGRGKWLLRRILADFVPPDHLARPKTGFGLPLGGWLRGPLREWAQTLLAPDAVRADGLLRDAVVSRLWSEHCQGRRDHTGRLWTVLSYLAWRRHIAAG